jgi:predicted ATPase
VLIALSKEQEFPFWLALGIILQGWALTRQGQGEKGIAQISHGLAIYRATGAELARTWFLFLLAEAYGKTGQDKEGLNTLAEAFVTMNRTGEYVHEPELYRLKGELTLQQPKVQGPKSKVGNSLASSGQSLESEAKGCFKKAIDIAQRQSAKSLELRAVMSLARLWQQQGKWEEARQMLAEIYGWFSEGFDTKDLQEAKALLTELEGRGRQRQGKRDRDRDRDKEGQIQRGQKAAGRKALPRTTKRGTK